MKAQDIRLLSIIVPVGPRRADLRELYRQYKAGAEALGVPCEIIFVLDGPFADAARSLDELLRAGEGLTVVTLTRSFGASAAINAGFERACGDAILTLPAYHQIDPQDIRKLLAALSTCDMAVGRRWPRYGGWFDRARRSAFHALVNFVTGSRLSDLGCCARVMRRQVLEEIDLYGDQHRFLAILALRLGFRIQEIDVRQSPLDRFDRIYRPREYARHALDVFSIFFLVRFTKKPLRFFGMLGAATFFLGAAVITILSIDRLIFGNSLADRPALLLAVLLVVLGMQIFALGLLGELIIFTHARAMKDYRVEEVIQYPDTVAVSADASDAPGGAPAPQEAGPGAEVRRANPPPVVV